MENRFFTFISMFEFRNGLVGGGLVALATLLFASKGIFIKLAYQYNVDSLSLLTLRLTISLPFFIGLLWYYGKQNEGFAKLKPLFWKVAIVGILGYHIASLFSFLGIQYITASMERVLLTSYPTMVLLISFFILRKRVSRNQVLALFLTYVGIIIAFASGLLDEAQDNFMLGGALILFCSFTYAIYLVSSGELIPKLGSQLFNAACMISACLSTIFHYLLVNGFSISEYPLEVYGYGSALAILGTVIPTIMFTEAIRLIGSGNTAIVTTIGPIFTIILAYIILGESLNLWQWVGTILVLFGVSQVVLHKNTDEKESFAK